MSEQLKELRAQRDLIKRHLIWLDTQITNAEGSVGQVEISAHQTSIARSASAATPTVEPSAAVTPLNGAPKVPIGPAGTASEIDDERHFTSGTSDIRRAQVGCFLFFVGGILLFLFFLFGLPYVID